MFKTLSTLLALLLITACGLPQARPGSASPDPPASAGKALELWQDAAIFNAATRLIDSVAAGRSLWVEMYEFGRADLARKLQEAQQRGVDVRVIVDRTVPASARTADRLLASGIAVRAYPVDDRRHQIDHVKLLLAGGFALVGGMNWGRSSARNHDYAFETGLPVILERLRAIFDQDWSLAGGHPNPLPAAAGAVAQTAPGEEVRHELDSAFARVRRSVVAEVFVLTDPEIISALAGAHRRGVRVRVLLDPGQDVNRSGFDLLRSTGVEVRWYPVPPGAKLHAKAGLFDAQLLILGSANWSASGLSVNHELDLASDDPQASAAFAARFERDWSASG